MIRVSVGRGANVLVWSSFLHVAFVSSILFYMSTWLAWSSARGGSMHSFMHDFRECWKGSNLSVSRKSKLNFEVDVVQMEVTQPAAKMLVELSKSQDIVAGDGTTTGQTQHFELQATYLCIWSFFWVSMGCALVVSWVAVENGGLLQRLTGSRYLLIVFVSLA